jgi:hypothetical protein
MDEHERRRRAAEQERRALHALESIAAGGDPGAESLALANEFTDRHTGRARAWLAATVSRMRGGTLRGGRDRPR